MLTKKKFTMEKLIKFSFLTIPIPFVLFFYFIHPQWDDYCYAVEQFEKGFWGSQLFWYNNLNGRYFLSAAMSFFSEVSNLFGGYDYGYKFIPLFLFITFFLGIYALVRSTAGEALSNQTKFWASLGLFIIYITMLKPAEYFYWLSGATTHLLPNILFLFLLSLLFSYAQVQKSGVFYRKITHFTICILLTFAIVGCNEIAAAIMLAVALLGVIITSYIKHSARALWRTIFIVAIICTFFTLIAPGNFLRSQEIHVVSWSADKVLFRALKGITNFRRYITIWVLSPALLSATLISLPFLAALKRRILFLQSTKVNWFFIACYTALWLSLTLLPFVMPLVAAGYLPLRAINSGYFIFLVGWCFWILLLLGKLPENDSSKLTVANPINLGMKIILLTSLLINSNFLHISKELVLDAPRYHSKILLRNKVINENIAAGDDSIEVDSVEAPSTLDFMRDTIAEDPSSYANICISRIYEIGSIASKKYEQ